MSGPFSIMSPILQLYIKKKKDCTDLSHINLYKFHIKKGILQTVAIVPDDTFFLLSLFNQ